VLLVIIKQNYFNPGLSFFRLLPALSKLDRFTLSTAFRSVQDVQSYEGPMAVTGNTKRGSITSCLTGLESAV
jgi:hypothetical protein